MEATTSKEGPSNRTYRLLLLMLYGIPLLGTLNNLCSIVAVLLPVPPGTSIRPMGLAMYVLLIAAVTALAGVTVSLIAIIRYWKVPVVWISGVVAMFLSLVPYWVGIHFFRWFSAYRGLVLAY